MGNQYRSKEIVNSETGADTGGAWEGRPALDEVVNVRVWGGIHFRYADIDGRQLGTAVGSYILANACQPLHGKHNGQLK